MSSSCTLDLLFDPQINSAQMPHQTAVDSGANKQLPE
jgi:hypothetical protein